MKINVTNPEPEFKPVTLSLTLESQAEVDAVYAMFHNGKVNLSVHGAFGVQLPSLMHALEPSNGTCHKLQAALCPS